MEIDKLSNNILEFCESDTITYKDNIRQMNDLFNKLRFPEIREEEVKVLISLHRELSKIKNRKAIYLEEEIARLVLVNLPIRIQMKDKDISDDIEELTEEYDTDQRATIKLSSELLKYAKEVIASKDDKSKRYKKRVIEAIRLLTELNKFYEIKGVKEIFQSKIEDKDGDLQFAVLSGLEEYYDYRNVDELTEEEEGKLEQIIKTTKDRSIASTCCQILINAGKMDEFEAVITMDDWKDKN